MAIQAHTAELLMLCRRRFPEALDFVMIGRQWLRLRGEDADRLSREQGIDLRDLADPAGTDSVYAEPLLQRIGLRTVRALDASSYEGADLVQDLNQPLRPELQECCDWIFDGGSLEHVFDFSTAIRNCAGMLRPNGLFVTACPVNNWMGHGFYQFSPELFFRVFSAVHGFEVRFAALHVKQGKKDHLWAIRDPMSTGKRLQFNPPGRMILLFVAQKVGSSTGRLQVQQSDYSARWKCSETGKNGASSGNPLVAQIKRAAKRCLPSAIVDSVQGWRVQKRRTRESQAGMQSRSSMAEAWEHWQA